MSFEFLARINSRLQHAQFDAVCFKQNAGGSCQIEVTAWPGSWGATVIFVSNMAVGQGRLQVLFLAPYWFYCDLFAGIFGSSLVCPVLTHSHISDTFCCVLSFHLPSFNLRCQSLPFVWYPIVAIAQQGNRRAKPVPVHTGRGHQFFNRWSTSCSKAAFCKYARATSQQKPPWLFCRCCRACPVP